MIKSKLALLLIIAALVVGYASALAINAPKYGNYNELELVGTMVIDSKVNLNANQIQVKVKSAHYTDNGLIIKNDRAVFGYSKWLKSGKVYTVEIADESTLKYAKNGAPLTMICREDESKIFNCEYEVVPMQMCPVPTPTPKPKPTPKPTPKSK